MTDNNAVLLLLVDSYPKEYYQFIEDDLVDCPLKVKVSLRKNGVMAGLEWAV